MARAVDDVERTVAIRFDGRLVTYEAADLDAPGARLRLLHPRLERLACYLFRPPLGQHRLRRLGDGRIAVALQRRWADGTTHLVFTPGELLERLATLVPRPRINLLLYHGVLAPNAPWRRAVVAREGDGEACTTTQADGCERATPAAPPSPVRERPRYRAWAELMQRA